MRRREFGYVLGALMLALTVPAFGQLDELSKRLGLGSKSSLSDSQIASGLKEALQVGASNAVKLTGRPDGYFGNAAIKILMPNRCGRSKPVSVRWAMDRKSMRLC